MLATQEHLNATLIVFVVSLALIDWRTHRIPNLLCAVGATFGLALQMGISGEAGLFAALGGSAPPFMGETAASPGSGSAGAGS